MNGHSKLPVEQSSTTPDMLSATKMGNTDGENNKITIVNQGH